MNLKYVAALLLLVAVLSAALTRYYFPKVEYKSQEVIKEVVRNDIKTIVKEITRPDGTKEIVTETTDKSERTEVAKKDVVINAKSQWLVSLTAKSALKDTEVGYELSVARRQLGPFYLVGQVGQKGNDISFGAGIGYEF